jgi:CheY-like chemotaxis protein
MANKKMERYIMDINTESNTETRILTKIDLLIDKRDGSIFQDREWDGEYEIDKNGKPKKKTNPKLFNRNKEYGNFFFCFVKADGSTLKDIPNNLLLYNLFMAIYLDYGGILKTRKKKLIKRSDICRLIISVEDTGRGIKPENISKLFTKFDRLEEDRNTTTEGTGLGLAITKHIVELMGGNITVQSVYGSGSKFTITLDQRIKKVELNNSININPNNVKNVINNAQQPVKENAFTTKEEVIQPKAQINVSTNFSAKRVLLIDDNKINLKVASKLLSSYGLQVVESNSGQDCIDRINNGEKFELLLTDEMMPNMSGTQMMQTLKSRGYIAPIVVLTADVDVNSKDKYIASGFDDYLGKPIDKKELDRVLKSFFIV